MITTWKYYFTWETNCFVEAQHSTSYELGQAASCPTRHSCHTTGILLLQGRISLGRSLDCPSVPPRAAKRSDKKAGGGSSLHTKGVVSGLWRWGRTGWTPAWTGTPSEEEDPSSLRRMLSEADGHGGGRSLHVAPVVQPAPIHTKRFMSISNHEAMSGNGWLPTQL